ncbi:MAG: hypothetical protein JWN95_2450 [Frankiales bacterium]|nr:hypothetical protein [Frankiales bacterium]
MSCYVDSLRAYPDAGLRHTHFCHLLADEAGELHAMADALGMPRRFFQEHPWRWHYDLPAPMRAEAIELGAREVDMHFIGLLLRNRRSAARDRDGGVAPRVLAADASDAVSGRTPT